MEWKIIDGTDNIYSVSDTGLVRNNLTGKLRVLTLDRYGYPKLNLYVHGKALYRTVHRLVASAFIPNVDNKPQVNHKDDNKENNNSNNLEWATAKENVAQIYQHGRESDRNGPNSPVAKLTYDDAWNIRFYSEGWSTSEIAALYNVDYEIVRKIRKGETYRNVTYYPS